jgi:hypothetical protein
MKTKIITPYPSDPIAEIRRIRDEIAAEYHQDIGAICRATIRRQEASGRSYVDRSQPRRSQKTRHRRQFATA